MAYTQSDPPLHQGAALDRGRILISTIALFCDRLISGSESEVLAYSRTLDNAQHMHMFSMF